MAFKTMAPEFRVTLYKTMSRRLVTGSDGRSVPAAERYSGGKRVLDLTPFFGDGSSLETSKSVRQPAGQWAMVAVDQMDADKLDSLYGLVEPTDVVEIRMRHRPDPVATSMAPPVVMRGFVSSVRRSMSMGADGRPARAVTISGADYGKVLEMIQIRYLPNYVIGQNLLTVLGAFVNYGIEAKPNQFGNDFVRQIVDKVVNPFLYDIAGFSVSPDTCKLSYLQQIEYEATASAGTISAFGAQSAQGTLWDIMRGFLDVGPWTELFIMGQCSLRPGMHLRVRHGRPGQGLKPFTWECYVVAVQHRMVPYQGFMTVATFERGTMFAEHIRRGAGLDSAYLAEWNQGGALG